MSVMNASQISYLGMDSDRERARAMAVRAIGFFVRDTARLDRFLSGTGIAPAQFWRRPDAAGHLLAALDHLIANETVLRDFARATDLPMEAIYEARRGLVAIAPSVVTPRPGANRTERVGFSGQ